MQSLQMIVWLSVAAELAVLSICMAAGQSESLKSQELFTLVWA